MNKWGDWSKIIHAWLVDAYVAFYKNDSHLFLLLPPPFHMATQYIFLSVWYGVL